MISTNVFCSQQESTLVASIPRCRKSLKIPSVFGRIACPPALGIAREFLLHLVLAGRELRFFSRMERLRLTKSKRHTALSVISVSGL